MNDKEHVVVFDNKTKTNNKQKKILGKHNMMLRFECTDILNLS